MVMLQRPLVLFTYFTVLNWPTIEVIKNTGCVHFVISLLSIRIRMVAASLLGDRCGVRIKRRVAPVHPISRLYTLSLAPLRIVRVCGSVVIARFLRWVGVNSAYPISDVICLLYPYIL